MNQILTIIQIAVGIALSAAILLQAKGSGLGSAWGGVQLYSTRRGFEKGLLFLTVFLCAVFFSVSIINFLLA